MVVNLYPFEATAAKPGLTAEELIENIDIGGPTMLRSAAKNFESVTVVTDPGDYGRVADELESARETSLATRLDLARKVFSTTSRYDGLITMELERLSAGAVHIELSEKPVLPERVHIALRKKDSLRYGENPHQAAALYVPAQTRRQVSRPRNSSRARSSPTTITWISKPPGAWRRNSPSPLQ